MVYCKDTNRERDHPNQSVRLPGLHIPAADGENGEASYSWYHPRQQAQRH